MILGFRKQRLGWLARWWRRRLLTHPPEVQSPIAADADEQMTPAEWADLAKTNGASRTLERDHNRKFVQLVRGLARHRTRLENARMGQLQAEDDVRDAAETLDRRLAEHAGEPVRHLSRALRWPLIAILAVTEWIAFKESITIAFRLSDEGSFARVEQYLVSLLSIGAVVASAIGASLLKAHHDTLPDEQRTRRQWRTVGVAAVITAIVVGCAGALLRVRAMDAIDDPTEPWMWSWILVPLFVAAPATGAFFLEYVGSSRGLDAIDRARARLRAARRTQRRMDDRFAARDRGHRDMEVHAVHLWDTLNSELELQYDMCAARISAARVGRPDLFHPRSTSVVTIIGGIARRSTVVDGRDAIQRHGLSADHIVAAAERKHRGRRPSGDGPVSVETGVHDHPDRPSENGHQAVSTREVPLDTVAGG